MNKNCVSDFFQELTGESKDLSSIVRFMSKGEIEEAIKKYVERKLEETDSGTIYIYLKLMEYGIKEAIENLKPQAFDALGQHLEGVSSGKFLGHHVSMSYPVKWLYTEKLRDLEEKWELKLKQMKEKERVKGKAARVTYEGRITVTLKE